MRFLDVMTRRKVRNVHLAICKALACRTCQDAALYMISAIALSVVWGTK